MGGLREKRERPAGRSLFARRWRDVDAHTCFASTFLWVFRAVIEKAQQLRRL